MAVFGDADFVESAAVHEVGHAFAGLGDEYFIGGYNSYYDVTRFPNLDTTSDLSIIKWHHFSNLKNYLVEAYEGGGYHQFGIWRPEYNSIMKSGSFFNAPSREAIVRRIMEIRGLEFNFEAFLEIDQKSIAKINSMGRQSAGNSIYQTNEQFSANLIESRNACVIDKSMLANKK